MPLYGWSPIINNLFLWLSGFSLLKMQIPGTRLTLAARTVLVRMSLFKWSRSLSPLPYLVICSVHDRDLQSFVCPLAFFFCHHHWLKSHEDRECLCLLPYPFPGLRWRRMCSINIWLDERPWETGFRHGCWNTMEGQRSAMWAGEAASQARLRGWCRWLGPRACFPCLPPFDWWLCCC